MIAVVYFKSLLFYPRESKIFSNNEDRPVLLARISLNLRENSLNQLGNTNHHLYNPNNLRCSSGERSVTSL
ncbi:hypothetical protein FOZ61_005676 [Perkinsus olseni]|uniref:Uncharacterized protein n=1 Tax=Perkinsus olseni TaxID=32597 RepID=A0A7J6LGV5_PEROL|nr:hypothetical protein FOZ61_005676 [Perkinsus olseni]